MDGTGLVEAGQPNTGVPWIPATASGWNATPREPCVVPSPSIRPSSSPTSTLSAAEATTRSHESPQAPWCLPEALDFDVGPAMMSGVVCETNVVALPQSRKWHLMRARSWPIAPLAGASLIRTSTCSVGIPVGEPRSRAGVLSMGPGPCLMPQAPSITQPGQNAGMLAAHGVGNRASARTQAVRSVRCTSDSPGLESSSPRRRKRSTDDGSYGAAAAAAAASLSQQSAAGGDQDGSCDSPRSVRSHRRRSAEDSCERLAFLGESCGTSDRIAHGRKVGSRMSLGKAQPIPSQQEGCWPSLAPVGAEGGAPVGEAPAPFLEGCVSVEGVRLAMSAAEEMAAQQVPVSFGAGVVQQEPLEAAGKVWGLLGAVAPLPAAGEDLLMGNAPRVPKLRKLARLAETTMERKVACEAASSQRPAAHTLHQVAVMLGQQLPQQQQEQGLEEVESSLKDEQSPLSEDWHGPEEEHEAAAWHPAEAVPAALGPVGRSGQQGASLPGPDGPQQVLQAGVLSCFLAGKCSPQVSNAGSGGEVLGAELVGEEQGIQHQSHGPTRSPLAHGESMTAVPAQQQGGDAERANNTLTDVEAGLEATAQMAGEQPSGDAGASCSLEANSRNEGLQQALQHQPQQTEQQHHHQLPPSNDGEWPSSKELSKAIAARLSQGLHVIGDEESDRLQLQFQASLEILKEHLELLKQSQLPLQLPTLARMAAPMVASSELERVPVAESQKGKGMPPDGIQVLDEEGKAAHKAQAGTHDAPVRPDVAVGPIARAPDLASCRNPAAGAMPGAGPSTGTPPNSCPPTLVGLLRGGQPRRPVSLSDLDLICSPHSHHPVPPPLATQPSAYPSCGPVIGSQSDERQGHGTEDLIYGGEGHLSQPGLPSWEAPTAFAPRTVQQMSAARQGLPTITQQMAAAGQGLRGMAQTGQMVPTGQGQAPVLAGGLHVGSNTPSSSPGDSAGVASEDTCGSLPTLLERQLGLSHVVEGPCDDWVDASPLTEDQESDPQPQGDPHDRPCDPRHKDDPQQPNGRHQLNDTRQPNKPQLPPYQPNDARRQTCACGQQGRSRRIESPWCDDPPPVGSDERGIRTVSEASPEPSLTSGEITEGSSWDCTATEHPEASNSLAHVPGPVVGPSAAEVAMAWAADGGWGPSPGRVMPFDAGIASRQCDMVAMEGAHYGPPGTHGQVMSHSKAISQGQGSPCFSQQQGFSQQQPLGPGPWPEWDQGQEEVEVEEEEQRLWLLLPPTLQPNAQQMPLPLLGTNKLERAWNVGSRPVYYDPTAVGLPRPLGQSPDPRQMSGLLGLVPMSSTAQIARLDQLPVSKVSLKGAKGSGPLLLPPMTPIVRTKLGRLPRGRAVDAHSFAERARRERIAQRMADLLDMTGCPKKADKLGQINHIMAYVNYLKATIQGLTGGAISAGGETSLGQPGMPVD